MEEGLRPKPKTLHEAAATGDVGACHRMLQNGADVDLRNEDRQTPLYRAAMNGRVDVMRLLIDNGANVNAVNKSGRSVLSRAASSGNSEAVKLLLARGANADDGDALCLAAELGHEEILKTLLAGGCPHTALSKEGQSALHRAVVCGRLEVARVLVRAGALRVTTPLHEAARHGNIALLQLLVEGGADPAAKDPNGRTALDLAKQYKHTDATLFLQNGKGALTDRRRKEQETELARQFELEQIAKSYPKVKQVAEQLALENRTLTETAAAATRAAQHLTRLTVVLQKTLAMQAARARPAAIAGDKSSSLSSAQEVSSLQPSDTVSTTAALQTQLQVPSTHFLPFTAPAMSTAAAPATATPLTPAPATALAPAPDTTTITTTSNPTAPPAAAPSPLPQPMSLNATTPSTTLDVNALSSLLDPTTAELVQALVALPALESEVALRAQYDCVTRCDALVSGLDAEQESLRTACIAALQGDTRAGLTAATGTTLSVSTATAASETSASAGLGVGLGVSVGVGVGGCACRHGEGVDGSEEGRASITGSFDDIDLWRSIMRAGPSAGL
eukprot:m.196253 g.196253  ORF g.196253 m.196253 type:complete len:562 (+) comp15462_c3_seq9:132-1817(+)